MVLLLPPLITATATDLDASGVLLDRAHHLRQTLLRVLSTEEDSLVQICSVIETAFAANVVSCDCAGTVESSLSISCKYATSVCHDDAHGVRTCGKPQIAVSMVNGRIFSATSCVSEYFRGLLPLEDTCVFVDACRDDSETTFCDCTASYGGTICGECRVCDGGRALTVDCSNVNPEAVTRTCAAVDLDLDLSRGAGAVAGFAPVWDGFCSQLEAAASPTNNVVCDCTNSSISTTNSGGGGNFDITCSTKDTICVPGASIHCGKVASNVKVVEGVVKSVTACADYIDNDDTDKDDPFVGQTCTEIDFCDSGNPDASLAPQLCGCRATFNGDACSACEICADGAALTLDCSNVRPQAVIAQCQAVSATSVYEFVPRYQPDVVGDGGPGSNLQFGAGQSAARPLPGQGKLLFMLSSAAATVLQYYY